MVYEIYIIDLDKFEETLKFGITSQCDYITKDGNPRPAHQVNKFQMNRIYKTCEIKYRIRYKNIDGRIKAKMLEQILVDEYYAIHKEMPPEQLRPIPSSLKIK